MYQYWRELLRMAGNMATHEWVFVLVGVIVVGLVCMRGFGSRSNY